MKPGTFFVFLLAITLCSLGSRGQGIVDPPKGNWTKGSSERFKGDVWVEYFINDTVGDFVSSRVLFAPSARSHWHRHSGRQIVFAVEGEGFYKEKGKTIRTLRKGDVVIIEPGIVHCHGSTDHRFVQGIMMNDIGKKETTIWLGPVSEEELQER